MNKKKIFWFSLLILCVYLFYFQQRFSKKFPISFTSEPQVIDLGEVPPGEYKVGVYIMSGGDYAGSPDSKLEVIDSEDNVVLTESHDNRQMKVQPDLKIAGKRNLRARIELSDNGPIHDGKLELYLKENQSLQNFILLLLCAMGIILSSRKLIKIFSN